MRTLRDPPAAPTSLALTAPAAAARPIAPSALTRWTGLPGATPTGGAAGGRRMAPTHDVPLPVGVAMGRQRERSGAAEGGPPAVPRFLPEWPASGRPVRVREVAVPPRGPRRAPAPGGG